MSCSAMSLGAADTLVCTCQHEAGEVADQDLSACLQQADHAGDGVTAEGEVAVVVANAVQALQDLLFADGRAAVLARELRAGCLLCLRWCMRLVTDCSPTGLQSSIRCCTHACTAFIVVAVVVWC